MWRDVARYRVYHKKSWLKLYDSQHHWKYLHNAQGKYYNDGSRCVTVSYFLLSADFKQTVVILFLLQNFAQKQMQCPCSIIPPSALSVQYNIVISCENVMAMPPITTPNTNLHILRITRILFLTATACPALTVIIRGYHRSENTHCVFISFHGDKWWWFYCPNITQTSFTNTAQSVELETKVHPKVRNYEKAITRAFSWLKAATTAFTFQT